MKAFEEYIQEWEKNAQNDAYWAVLTSSQYEKKPWDRELFFQTGVSEITLLKEYIQKKGLSVSFQGTALDFGCGVGRLSQALGRMFQHVYGIDVSENMIHQAIEALPPSLPQIFYQCNPRADLRIFNSGTFDFIYSNIVLQHIGKKEQRGYLAEFARVLKPGGWAIVQIPTRKNYSTLWKKIKGTLVDLIPYHWKKTIQVSLLGNRTRALKEFNFEINCCPKKVVEKIAMSNGLKIEHIAYTNACEPDFGGKLCFYSLEEAVRCSKFLSACFFLRKQK